MERAGSTIESSKNLDNTIVQTAQGPRTVNLKSVPFPFYFAGQPIVNFQFSLGNTHSRVFATATFPPPYSALTFAHVMASLAEPKHTASIASLHEHGVVVIPNIFTAAEADATVAQIWEWLGTVSAGRVRQDVPGSWRPKSWLQSVGKGGILQQYGAGQSAAAWAVRQHPAVAAVFEELWGTAATDMLVSFDGVCVQPPPEISGRWGAREGDNQHMDAGKKRLGKPMVVQAFLNLEDASEEDGCLVARPGSHKLFDAFWGAHDGDFGNEDWVVLQDKHRAWYDERGCPAVRVAAPKGSLVLWFSNTVHCASTAQPTRDDPTRFRYVVYVCMLPRALWSDKDLAKHLAKKREHWEDKRTTNHYPAGGRVFPLRPRQYGPPDPQVVADSERAEALPHPVLTAIGARLAGLT